MSRTAAVLMAVLAAGCIAGISGCAAAGTSQPRASVTACTEYGSWAIEHRVTVTRTPAPCQGLSSQDVDQAVAVAVSRAAAGGGRAARRRRAAEAGRYLAALVTAPPAVASPAPAGPGWQASATRQAAVPRTGRDLAMDMGALAAWLITAGSGAYVLGRWITRGGTLRRGDGTTGDAGSPPSAARTEANVATASTSVPSAVVVGHVGLGLAGLAFWIMYLVTGWAALAWTAVILLVPVAGLGMAVVTIGLPGLLARRAAAPSQGGGPGAGAAAEASRTRLAPLIVAGHGVLAASTMLVVLLAALGPAGT